MYVFTIYFDETQAPSTECTIEAYKCHIISQLRKMNSDLEHVKSYRRQDRLTTILRPKSLENRVDLDELHRKASDSINTGWVDSYSLIERVVVTERTLHIQLEKRL